MQKGVPRGGERSQDRAQLRRVLDQLDAGDVLMVTRLDRLARSTRDLLNTFATTVRRRGVGPRIATVRRNHPQ
jgi:DNA invertase Pin-like site-specific DNA recombinase